MTFGLGFCAGAAFMAIIDLIERTLRKRKTGGAWINQNNVRGDSQAAALKAAKSAAAAQETPVGSESDELPPPEASTSSQESAPSVQVTETPDNTEPPLVPSVDSEEAQPSVHADPSPRGSARQKKK